MSPKKLKIRQLAWSDPMLTRGHSVFVDGVARAEWEATGGPIGLRPESVYRAARQGSRDAERSQLLLES